MAVKPTSYDFSGWATKNDLRCGDGRVIRKDAFKGNDGQQVPLVFAHQHKTIDAVLGHAILENREDGVYAYCSFNDSEAGLAAKEAVRHGDVKSLSIYANNLKETNAKDVIHGVIRELSLVLAGANPGALIDAVLAHGDYEDEAIAVCYEEPVELAHSEELIPSTKPEEGVLDMAGELTPPVVGVTVDPLLGVPAINPNAALEHAAAGKNIQEIVDTMNEDQLNALYTLVGMAVEKEGGSDNMAHNLFENEGTEGGNTPMHDGLVMILGDGKRYGSLKESYLAHAVDYGIENIDYMFPDAKLMDQAPQWIKRQTEWVDEVITKTHHTPFSKIKSMFADITEDDARARGYIKGNMKKEEFFTLIKRTTGPTTIYKKQKLDRDDVLDIVDFDVVAWLKTEMRMMLDEEIARAILIGDGRLSSSDDKIKEDCIRPIWKDDALYTIKAAVEVAAAPKEGDVARAFIKTVIKSRKGYKGSGNPVCFTTEDIVTDCLLLEDTTGRRLYSSVADLATTLRVSKIVTVEVMENQSRLDTNGRTYTLMAILVNLGDYNVGADKGGAVNMFDDFDIDYNQQKYLIETRCSGALTKPYSAIAVESVPALVG